MDRRRLRAFLAFFKVKDDVSAVIQFFERETLQRVFVKVHLTAALLEDESVSLLREQFADHASKWRDRRRAHLGATRFSRYFRSSMAMASKAVLMASSNVLSSLRAVMVWRP